jgi:hypothetical protein
VHVTPAGFAGVAMPEGYVSQDADTDPLRDRETPGELEPCEWETHNAAKRDEREIKDLAVKAHKIRETML